MQLNNLTFLFQVGGGWTPAGGDPVGSTGKHRMAVLVRKSAPGSPTPSSASSYGTASPGNDLISSASSALRRLNFKSSGAQRILNRSKQQQPPFQQPSSPVPKLKVLGSSSVSVESSATVNTSTDSSAATMTTVTDDTENEDSVDNPVGQSSFVGWQSCSNVIKKENHRLSWDCDKNMIKGVISFSNFRLKFEKIKNKI